MIYLITHKIFNDKLFNNLNQYAILHVGLNSSYKDNYLKDTNGESISNKNQTFCELTGIYWIWKNHKDTEDIIGINHYRRYFASKKNFIIHEIFNLPVKPINYCIIEKILKDYDIIIPRYKNIKCTIKEFYDDSHDINDLMMTRQIIRNMFPDYLNAFDYTMNERRFIYGNMMICKSELFDCYCKWLFEILFTLEKNIDISKYSDNYQKRVFGFISERLLQVWINKNKLKEYEMQVINTDENLYTKSIAWLKRNIH